MKYWECSFDNQHYKTTTGIYVPTTLASNKSFQLTRESSPYYFRQSIAYVKNMLSITQRIISRDYLVDSKYIAVCDITINDTCRAWKKIWLCEMSIHIVCTLTRMLWYKYMVMIYTAGEYRRKRAATKLCNHRWVGDLCCELRWYQTKSNIFSYLVVPRELAAVRWCN